jgi:exodeoxyribonuclease VII large subunit
LGFKVLTVSQLNRDVRNLLEYEYPRVWVEGEISNLARPASGHIYFSLKDKGGQIRCAMFRNRLLNSGFNPKNGLQVLLQGKVSLYEGRGDYQLIVDNIQAAGEGLLQQQFEQLKNKLSQQGLFDSSCKQPLPIHPQRIGIITSPSGAAIQDVLNVLKRRFPQIPLVIYPVSVQGEQAVPDIMKAINVAQKRNECDVLMLIRGGGSIEDLWAFNNEGVALAIYHCRLPIITGVGHETDFTIADFVADVRAPTPSAAAEIISPDRHELMNNYAKLESQLIQIMTHKLAQQSQKLQWLQKQLQQCHPLNQCEQKSQRLDELEYRLISLQNKWLMKKQSRLQEVQQTIQQRHPAKLIEKYQMTVQHQKQQLNQLIQSKIQQNKQSLSGFSRALDMVSPLATLSRGYAIATHQKTKQVIYSADEAKSGDLINVKVKQGEMTCEVK